MASPRFTYNPKTCRYEPVHLTGKRLRKKVFVFLSLALVLSLTAFVGYINRFGPVEDRLLLRQNAALKAQWTVLQKQIEESEIFLEQLAREDDQNYRIILDLPPLSAGQRTAGAGGVEKTFPAQARMFPLILESHHKLNQLKHRSEVARQSFDQLIQVADMKNTMWASRPAIQPVDNRELTRLHTTFGLRMHPIFNVLMDHKGLDFTAPKGAPVYATGDGRVSMAYFSGTYGNVIYIDHGFDYETRYAHLYKFKVRPGQYVKRGELIGYVGNTGISVSPHLHYEVFYKGNAVNPIYFFQRDLNTAEYQKLIQSAGQSAASLD